MSYYVYIACIYTYVVYIHTNISYMYVELCVHLGASVQLVASTNLRIYLWNDPIFVDFLPQNSQPECWIVHVYIYTCDTTKKKYTYFTQYIYIV